MHPKICDDSPVIQSVQAYIRRIRNAEKRQYAQDFWAAMYRESADGITSYPDTAGYTLSCMGAQAVRMSILGLVETNRSTY